MIWLGEKRGNLSDWVTQSWVRTTGRSISLAEHPWLDGPVGGTRHIGSRFFESYAADHGLAVVEEGARGLLPNFMLLGNGNPAIATIAREVRDFYEQTSEFGLDVWSEWHGLFKPFGKVLSTIFSCRLEQLNVPLSSLDSARGMTSRVLQMRRPDGSIAETAWVRELHATGKVLYAGSYSTCSVPGHPSPCVKVVFPLPNGNAIVLMKVEVSADGSMSLRSIGDRFGDPGFYFVVHGNGGRAWARHVRSMTELIHVYPAEQGIMRTDHRLWIWGIEFLRLHYRMLRRAAS
ncbi:MAG TPA: hypothetical protein VKB38_18330 [Terracidiphilus sp.]|nr:hypothetical protein [Terracidiphilus sp.]